MHYSAEPDQVRVDFFKASGKWGYTESMKWLYYDKSVLIHDAFSLSLYKHLIIDNGHYRMAGMTAVCLEPYHEHAYPLMMHVFDAIQTAELYMRKHNIQQL